MTRFSIGDVDKPTQATIVKGFQRYTRAAISPEESISSRKQETCEERGASSGGRRFKSNLQLRANKYILK